MRQIVLDIETTGLNAKDGDRIIEIGAVELIDRQLTGNHLHFYINPERDSDPGALAVHGLTTEFLSDKPKFAEIVTAIENYVVDAEIIIHNASFDLGFLDSEFTRLNLAPFSQTYPNILDSLQLARSMYPGKRNSLDALCDRLEINNSHRTLHGALLDAEILAKVYLAMTRGQEALLIEPFHENQPLKQHAQLASHQIIDLPILYANSEELHQHEAQLDLLDQQNASQSIWRKNQ